MSTCVAPQNKTMIDDHDTGSDDGSSTPLARLANRYIYKSGTSVGPTCRRAWPSRPLAGHSKQSWQSIDAVVSRTVIQTEQESFHSHHTQILNDNDDEEDEFEAFDKLIEAYEDACAHGDFNGLLVLPLPSDVDDIWSEIEDVVIRNKQWDSLLVLMQRFGKEFDTDFVAEIVSSGYEDEQKICVIQLALSNGWDINSSKSDGGHILNEALDNETDDTLTSLLGYGANPNILIDGLTLDHSNPLTTCTGLPLQDALEYGTLAQTELLLSYGADPQLANAIHTAIRSSEHEEQKLKRIFDCSGAAVDKNAPEWAGNPHMSALLDAHEGGVQRLAPISLAYMLGKANVVQFLLDPRVDPGLLSQKRRPDLARVRRERKMKERQKQRGLKMDDSGESVVGDGVAAAAARSGSGFLSLLGSVKREVRGASKDRMISRSTSSKKGVRL